MHNEVGHLIEKSIAISCMVKLSSHNTITQGGQSLWTAKIIFQPRKATADVYLQNGSLTVADGGTLATNAQDSSQRRYYDSSITVAGGIAVNVEIVRVLKK